MPHSAGCIRSCWVAVVRSGSCVTTNYLENSKTRCSKVGFLKDGTRQYHLHVPFSVSKGFLNVNTAAECIHITVGG